MKGALYISVLLCCVARAQTVQGTVIDAASRQPVNKASVTITALSPDRSYAVAITNSAGQFTLGGIPQGRYRIVAGRTGYLSVPYGALAPQRPGVSFNMAAGESRAGVILLLSRANSVSGTVTDPDGDGIAEIKVALYKKQWNRGKPHFQQLSSAATDSHGRYQIGAVQQGEYSVAALTASVPANRGRSFSIVGETVPQETTAPQIYPAPIVVAGNDLTGIDFHLNFAAQLTVHGTVSGAPEGANLSIRLESELAPGMRGSQFFYGVPSGQSYKINGVTAGAYRLTAHAGLSRALLKLNLTAPNTEVNIALAPGVPLAGAVTVEGSLPERFRNFHITLSPAEEDLFPPRLRADVEDGEFEFDEVPAGIWDIGVTPLPSSAYIKSMHLGKQDVLFEDMEISPNTKGPLTIVISTAAARAEGTVEPAGPATILAAPTGKLANMSSFFATAQSDEQGHFTLRGLNPGTYRFYAFRDIEPESWQDPNLLQPYELQSKTADLTEGATAKLTLPVIGVSRP